MAHPGQGTRLPESMGVIGEWIYENRWFVASGPDAPLTVDRSPYTWTIAAPNGARCFGIELEYLAQRLDVTSNDLLRMNRSGEIVVRCHVSPNANERGGLFFTTPKKVLYEELDWVNPGWND